MAIGCQLVSVYYCVMAEMSNPVMTNLLIVISSNAIYYLKS